MDLKVIVGNAATVFTILNFASGIQICIKIYKKGATADISSLPFLAGILSTFLWLEYGIKKPDHIVLLVNAVGLVLQVSFLSWYYVFTKQKSFLHMQMLTLFLVLSSIYFHTTYLAASQESAAKIVGLLGCGAALFFFGSPLASLADVLRNKSVENLPFLLILSAFIVSSLWFFYGLLVDDALIYAPNMIGAVITGFQLCLFLIFPSEKKAVDLQIKSLC